MGTEIINDFSHHRTFPFLFLLKSGIKDIVGLIIIHTGLRPVPAMKKINDRTK